MSDSDEKSDIGAFAFTADDEFNGETFLDAKGKKTTYGRPKIPVDVKLTKKSAVGFTEQEFNTIEQKAGRIPMAVFIKDFLLEKGFFE